MKTIILTIVMLISISATAQKTNLDKLSEKERTEHLIKTAREAIDTHAPGWFRDYKAPEITSNVIKLGDDKGRLQYAVTWFYDPAKEKMYQRYAIGVGIYADTGEVRGFNFGDGTVYIFPQDYKTRSMDKPYIHPYKNSK